MQSKRHFQRLTIDDMKAKKAQIEMERKLAELMSYIDDKINSAVNDVVNELGYTCNDEMTFEEIQQLNQQMQQDGISLEVETKQVDSKYIAVIKVVQVARTLEFDLRGEE
jgi:C-terminal processing protease CtpA/Prc